MKHFYRITSVVEYTQRTISIKREKGKKEKKPSSSKKWKRSEVSEFQVPIFQPRRGLRVPQKQLNGYQRDSLVLRADVILYVIIVCVDTTYYHETPAVVHQRRETPVHPLHACLDEARPLRHGEFTNYTHSVFSLKRQHDFD